MEVGDSCRELGVGDSYMGYGIGGEYCGLHLEFGDISRVQRTDKLLEAKLNIKK